MQTSVDRPRFRQDLVAEPIEDGGSKFIDVMDPDSGQLFRFYEVEYSLACAMDGERDVAGIVRWAKEELGLEPSQAEVRNVIATLGDLGYLEGAAAAAATAPAAAASAPAAAVRPAAAAPVAAAPSQRWDQPTAMGDADEYLQPGVVAGGARAHTPAPDVELGQAGTRKAPVEELPKGAPLELGAPGSASNVHQRVTSRGQDIALGAPGPGQQSNVSIDLSEHVGVGADDVKEAVRASKVMGAVDIPPELAAELEAKPTPKAEPPKAGSLTMGWDAVPEPPAEAKPAPKVEAKPSIEPPARVEVAPVAAKAEPKVEAKPAPKEEPKPAPKVEAKPAPKAEAKPAPKEEPKPAKAETKPAPKAETKPAPKETKPAARPETKPPAPKSGVSPLLIAALVIIALGAGAFAVYKFVLKKDDTTPTSKVEPPVEPPKPVEPPPPPPVETAKLASEQPVPEELKPTGAGQIAVIVATDTMVKGGEPVAKLVGFKSLEADVAKYEKQIAKATTDLAAAEKERDAAQTAGNKNGVTAAEKKIAAAQKIQTEQGAKLTTKQGELDKFLLKAPAAGKVTAVAKANSKITPTDVVATLTRDPILVATFKKADGANVDSRVLLAIKGTEQKLQCVVTQQSGDGTRITCPKDAAPEGTEVTYVGVDPGSPAPPPDQGAVPTPPAPTPAPPAPTPAPAEDKPAAPAEKPAEEKTEKAEEKAEKPARRPRPRPRPTPAGSATPPAGGEQPPAEKPADPPPAPPAEGSAS